jgi:hypothetical protein
MAQADTAGGVGHRTPAATVLPAGGTGGRPPEPVTVVPAGGTGPSGMGETSDRLRRARSADPAAAALVDRLLGVATDALPQMYADGIFAFRVDGTRDPDGAWRLTAAGTSARYTAIAALGLNRLTAAEQRLLLAGDTCDDLIDGLAGRADQMTSLGDVAVSCWAAADCGHAALPRLLSRLSELAASPEPRYAVDAAWLVSALVAARPHADVEEALAAGRDRLLAARGRHLYPHVTSGSPWYRAHVGSFADQIYPLQALARLHRSAADPEALAVAGQLATALCAAQGKSGQWWWHYDARTGAVVEGYPVYTVHQHAMAPMALLDLAEANGPDHMDAIGRGLRWLAEPTEAEEPLVPHDVQITWRKVARNDRGKLVRGLRAAGTRVSSSARLRALDRRFPPGTVDHECRPYELGWLLAAWLT